MNSLWTVCPSIGYMSSRLYKNCDGVNKSLHISLFKVLAHLDCKVHRLFWYNTDVLNVKKYVSSFTLSYLSEKVIVSIELVTLPFIIVAF